MNPTVAVVIVTYNRQELLKECLESLENQTVLPNKIFIINNASTDNTKIFLESWSANHIVTEIKNLNKNHGGAGGFNCGISLAFQQGFDWVWIMDDDTIPNSTALEKLLEADKKLKENTINPWILASRVDWVDNTPHPMNMPSVSGQDWDLNYFCLNQGLFPIRSASFVSILVSSKAIEQFGLPLADYFIWSDDVEYTARILKENTGFIVPQSIVTHKTKTKYTPLNTDDFRLYYSIRNAIWLSKSSAWGKKERWLKVLSNIAAWHAYLKKGNYSLKTFKAVIRPILHGLFTSPQFDKEIKE